MVEAHRPSTGRRILSWNSLASMAFVRTRTRRHRLVPAALILTAGAAIAVQSADANDWNTGFGANSARTGLSAAHGPLVPNVLWDGSLGAFISESPVIGDGKVFIARMTNSGNYDTGATIVAHDLKTGQVAWSRTLPTIPG